MRPPLTLKIHSVPAEISRWSVWFHVDLEQLRINTICQDASVLLVGQPCALLPKLKRTRQRSSGCKCCARNSLDEHNYCSFCHVLFQWWTDQPQQRNTLKNAQSDCRESERERERMRTVMAVSWPSVNHVMSQQLLQVFFFSWNLK